MADLRPKSVFDYFALINKVPRPSKHEEKLIALLQQFAAENKLECNTDSTGNVIIRKKATPGMEQRETVILQSHMDMVCEKDTDTKINFTTDSIQTYTDGDWLRARGTTLGADDGIGIAIEMALLTATDIEHGPLECVFTRDEETGLSGAKGMQTGFMTGKYLINLDSEDEGEIFIGCAGGVGTVIDFTYRKEKPQTGIVAMKICIDRLTGGHSGDDINKNRANANKLLARILYQLMQRYGIGVASLNGGNLSNAIPRNAEAVITVDESLKHDIRIAFNIISTELEAEYHKEEPDMHFTMESADIPDNIIDSDTAYRIVASLQAVHNGVLEWSQDIPGLVETSSNLASIRMEGEDKVRIVTSQRSSIDSQKLDMQETIAATFRLAGADITFTEGYSGWTPNPDSVMLKTAVESYKAIFHRTPVVRAIHAGLECGMFSEKYPHLDMISIGPTLRGVHSPDERLLIPTVQMVWDHLTDILRRIPEKQDARK